LHNHTAALYETDRQAPEYKRGKSRRRAPQAPYPPDFEAFLTAFSYTAKGAFSKSLLYKELENAAQVKQTYLMQKSCKKITDNKR